MKTWIGAAALTLAGLGLSVTAGKSDAAQIEHLTVQTADGMREFWMATPDHVSSGPRPLVLLLHGHAGNATQILSDSGGRSPLAQWMPIVDRERIVAVAMQGRPDHNGRLGWNDCRSDTDSNAAVDDVAFARAVIAAVDARGLVDRSRIYAMGMSNGAMMTLRLAQELDPPLAAFAAASGSMASASNCRPIGVRMSALFIAGTEDPLVPYEGGQVHFYSRTLGGVVSIENSVAYWRDLDGLGLESSTLAIPHLSADDTTRASRILYGSDPAGLQVELIRISGGGHFEPSLVHHPGALYGRIVGLQNRDFESAEEAWRFFADKRQSLAKAR